MTRGIRIQSRAALDLRDHFLYLARQDSRVATRFGDAIDDSFQRLLENPDLGFTDELTHPRLQDVRCWPVRGFSQHVIYYRSTVEGIEVLRVMHGSRDAENLL